MSTRRRSDGRNAAKSRFRRATALFAALACVAMCTAACTAEPAASESGTEAESVTGPPDATCPVTTPMSPGRYPEPLRDGGKVTWYGGYRLWLDLADVFTAPIVDDLSKIRLTSWTADGTGRATSEGGPPRVVATRLDAPGRAVATVGDYASLGDDPGWPIRLTLRGPGCWLLTGELGSTVVRVVVKTD